MLEHSPSVNILVIDLAPICTSPASWTTHYKPSDTAYYEDYAPKIHSEGANYAFTDGHVELIKKPACGDLPPRYYSK